MPNLLQARPARNPATGVPPEDTRSDAELVTLGRVDPRAFALLYARYVDPVHRYCYRRLGNREAAEDATSLVFMKALAALPHYHDASFRGWLFTIAHHVIVDRYRTAHTEQALEDAGDLLDNAPSPEDLAFAAAERSTLHELLMHLPDHQRQVVELRLAGLTGAEIAHALGRSTANVNVTQFRAVARLRVLLGLAAAPEETGHDE